MLTRSDAMHSSPRLAAVLLAALALVAPAPGVSLGISDRHLSSLDNLASGLAAPPAEANVTDSVSSGLDATGTITDEDGVPVDSGFDNASATLQSAADSLDDSIGDGTSAAPPAGATAATFAAAAAAATAAAVFAALLAI